MKIPLFKIFWRDEDIAAVEKIIRSGRYWCTGSEIAEFEGKIADYMGSKHCVVFNSGGSALHALMSAYGFGGKDEIIVPSFTFIATAYAPMYVGAKPVFADVEEKAFGLDPEDVKNKIGPATKAIMPIHYGGMPCMIDELRNLAEDSGLVLIEDAAESFGAKYRNQLVGTFGDSAMLSFCHNKIFTTSEGGAIVTENDEVCNKLKLFRSYGRVVEGDYFSKVEHLDYVELGHNLRMSTLLAALGISQLEGVHLSIEGRRKNADYLNQQLEGLEEIGLPTPPSQDYYAVYQMYTIRVKQGQKKRDELIEHLNQRGISSRIYFDPLHKYSVFTQLGFGNVDLPTTELLSSQVLTLPMYPHMTRQELDYIVESLVDFL